MTCTVEGCGQPIRAKGYCYAHYMLQYRMGTTDKARRPYTDITGQRFASLVPIERLADLARLGITAKR